MKSVRPKEHIVNMSIVLKKKADETKANNEVSGGCRVIELPLDFRTDCKEHLQEQASDDTRPRSQGRPRVESSQESLNQSAASDCSEDLSKREDGSSHRRYSCDENET